jgi:hypothetical protein
MHQNFYLRCAPLCTVNMLRRHDNWKGSVGIPESALRLDAIRPQVGVLDYTVWTSNENILIRND